MSFEKSHNDLLSRLGTLARNRIASNENAPLVGQYLFELYDPSPSPYSVVNFAVQCTNWTDSHGDLIILHIEREYCSSDATRYAVKTPRYEHTLAAGRDFTMWHDAFKIAQYCAETINEYFESMNSGAVRVDSDGTLEFS